MGTIAENLHDVLMRINAAAAACGRDGSAVTLVVVGKGQSASRIREALRAGATDIGENYVQEAEAKFGELSTIPARKHMIGRLQRNKAGRAVQLFDCVQTVDSLELAAAVGRRASLLGKELDALIEVNCGGEQHRTGVAPDRALDLAAQSGEIRGIRISGLMGIAPNPIGLTAHETEKVSRESFQGLARLFEQLPRHQRLTLSMGMSGDFESAIREGSTMVRIGTAIFGSR